MKKKLLALVLTVVLACAMLVTLAGCGGETFDFEALSGNTQGTVNSNGGIIVEKGNYIYYVNAIAPNTNPNYFGDAEYGAVYRILKTEFIQAIAEEEGVNKLVAQKSELLVPKIVYSANTSAKALNGIFIYGDRLYYTSPDTTPDKNGRPQSSRLSLLSCKLDGTDTVVHLTVDTNSTAICLSEISGTVYALYVSSDADLYCANLTERAEPQKFVQKIVSYIFSLETATIYYIDIDGNICGYTAGGANAKVIYQNPQIEDQAITQMTFTLKSSDRFGNLYFTAAGLLNDIDGLYMASMTTAAKILTRYIPANYFCYNGYVYSYGLENAVKVLVRYNPAVKTYDTLGVLSTEPSRYLDFDGITLYYADSSSFYSLNVTQGAGTTSKQLASKATATGWADYDICAGQVFVMSSTSNGTLYPLAIVKQADDRFTEVNIMYFPETDDK